MKQMSELELYYNKFNEEKRLDSRHGQVEFITSMKYIHKYLEELHKNPKKIVLNCIGRGEEIAIGFSKGMRKDAIELSRRCKEYNIKTKSMSELDLMHTPAHALSDVLYISCGKFEEEHFVVYDTAGFKDKKIDEKRCEEVKNIVQTYIQM